MDKTERAEFCVRGPDGKLTDLPVWEAEGVLDDHAPVSRRTIDQLLAKGFTMAQIERVYAIDFRRPRP